MCVCIHIITNTRMLSYICIYILLQTHVCYHLPYTFICHLYTNNALHCTVVFLRRVKFRMVIINKQLETLTLEMQRLNEASNGIYKKLYL